MEVFCLGYGVVLVSHGGEKSKSNKVAKGHGEKLIKKDYLDIDEIKFASIHQKNLKDKINELDSKKVFVLPFLTSPGQHYNHDIPDQIDRVKEKDVELLETFGDHEYVTEALASILKDKAEGDK